MPSRPPLVLLTTFFACSGGAPSPIDAGVEEDAGVVDAGVVDAGIVDHSCDGARPLGSTPVLANTLTGTSTWTSECGGDGNDLLYRVTLTEPRDVLISANPMDIGRPIVALFSGSCAPGRLETIACSNGTLTAYDVPAGDYYVLVDSPAGMGGPSELSLVLTAPTLPPANDACAQAQVLTFTNGKATVVGDTAPATNGSTDAGVPSCSVTARAEGRDVVYQYTLTQPHDVKLTVTSHGDLLPVLAVTAACEGPELACVAGPTLSLTQQPAGTYFIWVDGAAIGTGHATGGGFTLAVELP